MPNESAPALARLTPYELVFEAEPFETSLFPAVVREAEEGGVDLGDPDRLAFLTVAADLLRELVPAEAPPEALEQHRLFLHHALAFWRFGKRLYTVDRSLARYLVEAAPDTRGWPFRLPSTGAYVQLPANLFWGSVATDAPPEPIDGFFVTCTERQDALGEPYQQLDVLLVLGIHRGRIGFSLIPLCAELATGTPAPWEEPAEEGRAPFRSDLPGGEAAGLYSVLTTSEAFTLVGRALWYIDRHPGAVTAHAADEHRGPGVEATPLSHLSFFRVALDDARADA